MVFRPDAVNQQLKHLLLWTDSCKVSKTAWREDILAGPVKPAADLGSEARVETSTAGPHVAC
jgi:hypothetical protein